MLDQRQQQRGFSYFISFLVFLLLLLTTNDTGVALADNSETHKTENHVQRFKEKNANTRCHGFKHSSDPGNSSAEKMVSYFSRVTDLG